MSLPAYTTYKDSGIEWLGRVPNHWTVQKLKHFARFAGGGTPSRDIPNYWNGDIPWVSPKDMKAECIESTEERITVAGMENSMSNLVEANQVLLVVRSGILKHTIPVAINSVPVTLNQDMKALALDVNVCTPKFFMRWIQGLNDSLLLAWAKQGATVESIEHSYLANSIVPLPSIEEQIAIVAFLEREIAKIDALIAEQEELITLLAEKRQATISHTVTKGLHLNVPMKDSGIAWLGEVPACWNITRLKFVAAVQSGIAKGKDTTGKQIVNVPYLRVANVQDGFLALQDVATIDIEAEQLDRYRLISGDVLMNEGGDFDKLGRGAIWRGEITDCIHQNHVFAVRPHGVSAEWLNRITSSQYAQFYFMGRSKQSTNLASISATNIMELPVVLPPQSEQQAILAFIDSEIKKLDSLKDEAQRAINLLQERRSALIAAAVTGQIDVRGNVAQACVEIPEPIAA